MVPLIPTLFALLVYAYWFHLSTGSFAYLLWKYLFSVEPSSATGLALDVFVLGSCTYALAMLICFFNPTKKLLKPFKLNPKYPDKALLSVELLRSIRGLVIAWIIGVGTSRLYERDVLPSRFAVQYFSQGEEGELSLFQFLGAFAFMYFFGDTHFYWTHRILHAVPWLYKNVHKIHHQSFNPNPLSGLSMHWAESCIYFSAVPMIACFTPPYISRLLLIGLVLEPIDGHHGFGSWNIETTYNHYIHHSKFNYNFGSSPLWDHLMGTEFPTERKNN